MVTDAWGEEKDRWPINVAINTNAWYLVNFYIIHILCFLYLLSSRCNSGNKMWYNLLLWFPPLTEQHVSRGTWPGVAAAGGGVMMMDARSQETLTRAGASRRSLFVSLLRAPEQLRLSQYHIIWGNICAAMVSPLLALSSLFVGSVCLTTWCWKRVSKNFP